MPGGLNAVREDLRRLLASGRTALAVSGGADSLALLELTRQVAAEAGAHDRVIVYSVDHGLRPEASDEVRTVVALAEQMGFAARSLRWEAPKPETGIQAAARQARYGLMAAAMADDGAGQLLTAHHLRDQAETVLMRLAHGSGLVGLQGMRRLSEVEGCRVIRPLLAVAPDALRAVVEAAGLLPVEDPSNADPHYERVRWRDLLPQLEFMGLTPERLATLAERSADAAALVMQAVEMAWVQLADTSAPACVTLPQTQFATLNPLVAAGLLERALLHIGNGAGQVPLGPVESLARQLALPGFRGATLHGCVIALRGDSVVIGPEPPRRAVGTTARTAPARDTELT